MSFKLVFKKVERNGFLDVWGERKALMPGGYHHAIDVFIKHM